MGRQNSYDASDARPDFDPFEIPADVSKAESHLLATRIARPFITANSIPPEALGLPKKVESLDPASLLPIDNQLLPICIDTEELSFLSPGYPLYMQYIKFCILIGIFIFLFSGIFNLKTSFEGTSCYDSDHLPSGTTKENLKTVCVKNFITEMSLANKFDSRENLEKQEIYNFFTILILLLTFQFMRKIQIETALVCDERDLTAADYTVLIRNFPRDFDQNVDVDEQVEIFFREKGLPGQKLNIQVVSCCYDCAEKIKIIEELNELGVKKTKLKLESEKKYKESIATELMEISIKMDQLKEDLLRISSEFEDGKGMVSKFTGEAYITLSTEQEVAAILKHWEMPILKYIKERFFKNHSPYKFRGHFLEVREAPEPSNVNWKNSGVSDSTRVKRRCVTYFAGSLLLLGSAWFIMYISEYTEEISSNLLSGVVKDKNKDDAETAALIMLVSSAASIVIVVINMVLKIILEFFSEYEAYSTMAEQQSSYAFKLAVSQFLNTSIVTLGVCMWAGNIWGPGGLIEAMYAIFYFNAFIPWIVDILDIPYLIKLGLRYKYRREGPKILMCQKDLNTVFENPIFDFPTKYAVYTKTICSAAFFAPLIPMAMVWAVIGLIGSYWIDKFIMLRRRSRIGTIGEELAFEFLNHLEYTIILFAAGNFFFYSQLSGFNNNQLALSICGFSIGILNAIIPMESINDAIFPKKEINLSSKKYWEVKYYLLEDYDRSNPATQEVAKKKFLDSVEAASKK